MACHARCVFVERASVSLLTGRQLYGLVRFLSSRDELSGPSKLSRIGMVSRRLIDEKPIYSWAVLRRGALRQTFNAGESRVFYHQRRELA